MADQPRPRGTPSEGMQKVEQKTTQATQQAADKAQSAFDNAKMTVRRQVSAVSQAINCAADTLEQHGQHGLSQRVKPYVQKAENAANYLENKSPRELKNDLERFAREQPAWFLGVAFFAGLLGARFLKSSEHKTESWDRKGSVEYARA